MTDGAEETPSDVDGNTDSQGVDRILLELLHENEANGIPVNNFNGLSGVWEENSSDASIMFDLQEIGSNAIRPTVSSPVEESYAEDPLSVKSDDGARVKSPDSGCSCTVIDSNEPQRSDQIPAMFEIPAQPVVVSPARSNYPGHYIFQAVFPDQDHVPKSANYTYSPALDKLFVKMNTIMCMHFKCAHPPPPLAIIRAMLLFQKPEHMHEAVCRCQTHLFKDNASDVAHHVLQTADGGNVTMQSTAYDSSGGRFSVSVPYNAQSGDHGCEPFVIPYIFKCLSTCIGGINRRPLLAVFTLEDGCGATLGRVVMEIKICSCPGRDRPKEEERKRRQESSEARGRQETHVQLPRKRHRDESAGQGYKFLRVKEENYAILSEINNALNLASLTTAQQRSQYQEEEQRNNWKELLAKFCRDSFP